MDRRSFLAGCGALLALASCARDEKRAKVFDEKQCPFCTMNPGTCDYCKGSGKCSFCGGNGKRKTAWFDVPEENIHRGSLTEECTFCKGTGTCRYCNGNKKCWACKGSGRVNNWDFYGACNNEKK